MLWTKEHRVFAYDTYLKNNESVKAVRREFRGHFNIHRNQSGPTHKTIIRWVNALCTQGTLELESGEGPTKCVHRKMWNVPEKLSAESQSICLEAFH